MKKAELVIQLRLFNEACAMGQALGYLNFLPNLSGLESNLALQLVQQKPIVLPLYSEVTPSLTSLPLMGQVVFTGAALAMPAATKETARRVRMDFMGDVGVV